MIKILFGALVGILLSVINAYADSRPVEDVDKKLIHADQETKNKLCVDKNPNLIVEYPLPGEPSFWVKPFEYGKKLYFTGVLNGRSVIVDAKNGKTIRVDGNQDPLVSFDNKVMSVLKGNAGRFSLDFYSPIGAGDPQLEKHKVSLKVFGAYQSIAPLKNENGSTIYRMMLDKIEEGGQGTTTPSILEFELTAGKNIKIRSEFKNPCPDKKLQTPFLSKDGKMFAALNLETQTTQIFDISSGQCLLKEDVGFITGKADFNTEGTKIVFHITGVAPAATSGWIRSIKNENWSNVYTYDLGTKKITSVTQNINTNSYYPTFMNDGTIMHINSKPLEGRNSSFSIGISKDPGSSQTEGSICTSCTKSKLIGKLAVGQLVAGICATSYQRREGEIDINSLIIKASELPNETCKSVINRYWSNEVQDLLDANLRVNYKGRVSSKDMVHIKKEDLLAACDG